MTGAGGFGVATLGSGFGSGLGAGLGFGLGAGLATVFFTAGFAAVEDRTSSTMRFGPVRIISLSFSPVRSDFFVACTLRGIEDASMETTSSGPAPAPVLRSMR